MKKTTIMFALLMMWASHGWADEIDDALKDIGNQHIRSNTRQMVQAGMPQDEAIELTRFMRQNRFSETATIRAQQMLIQTQNSGLPAGPVMSKLYEGTAKKIPEQTILQAMEKTRLCYSFAYQKAQAITSNPTNRTLLGETIAESMRAGLQDSDVDQIMAQLHTRTRQMTKNSADELALHSFLAARTMARLGVNHSSVTDVISKAIRHQYAAQEMQQIMNQFKAQSKYVSPNQLAAQYAKGVENGDKPDELGREGGGSQQGGTTQQGSSSGSAGSRGESGGSGKDSGRNGGKRGK